MNPNRSDQLIRPARHRATKPDLAVAEAGIAGDPYLFFVGPHNTVTITDTVVNRGSGRAGPTLNRVYLEHDGRHRLLADRAVPALRPGERDSGEDSIRESRFPLGAYTLVICADAKRLEGESNEGNSARIRDPRWFFVAAKRWHGSLGGTQTTVGNGELTERWSSSSASLDFDQYEGAGVFTYLFSGAVTWNLELGRPTG